MQAILADTQFLASNSIMDYSLLTALDEDNGELVVGIIGELARPWLIVCHLNYVLREDVVYSACQFVSVFL